MNEQEKIELIAEILEVEPDDVVIGKKLEEYDTWDSVAILSVIAVMNEKFEKTPSAKDVAKNKTIDELMSFLQ